MGQALPWDLYLMTCEPVNPVQQGHELAGHEMHGWQAQA